jgi:type IV pilus assembly protein PilA
MRTLLKNRKGFTLIELLAVIVILAVLILVATPAVTNLMNRARISSFRVEALEMANVAETAFEEKESSGFIKNVSDRTITSNNTPTADVYEYIAGNGDRYLCMTVAQLANGYIKKDISLYSGRIEVLQLSTGSSSTKISVTNGTYTVKKLYSEAQKGDYSPDPGNGLTDQDKICPNTIPTSLS